MENIIDYVNNEYNSFNDKPFNEVDSLVCGWLSYFHYEYLPQIEKGLSIQKCLQGEHFKNLLKDNYDYDSSLKLLYGLASSPRYRDGIIKNYIEIDDPQIQMQFGVISIQFNDLLVISFRGTDNSFIGWKEDFNMSFKDTIPSQLKAVSYVNKYGRYAKRIILTGHSKGGNLSIYSAINCNNSIKKKIINAYSLDGPGINDKAIKENNYKQIEDRLIKLIPQSSVIGMILDNSDNARIIKSNRVSFWQHDPFSWLINNNEFIYQNKLTMDAKIINNSIASWLNNIPGKQREEFIDTLYDICISDQFISVNDFKANLNVNIPMIMDKLKHLDNETKNMLIETLKQIASISIKQVPNVIKQEVIK